MSPMPPSKYRDFNVFKKDVEKLWREYGKFPSNDFLRGLKRFDLIKGFKYHGGFRNVRGVMEAPPTESPYRDFAKLETELRKLVEKHGELSNPILKREKRGDLISAIDNFHGGLNAVRKKMGLPVVLTPKPLSPMRDWSFFSIELKKWMEAHEGGFPTHAQLQAEKRSDLILGMNTHEGYPAVRERMGIEPEKNPFTEFNNLRKALAPIIKMHGGKYPSPAHITKNHPELEHAIRYYHGGHVATRLRLGVEPVGRPPHPFEDKETFLNALKAVRERLGRQPTQDDLIAEKRFDILYFLNKKTHGTYSEIKKDLRWLKEPKPKRRKLKFSSKEEFMDQLRGIRTEFGRRPTQEEVFRIGGRNFATAIRNKHYGSWDAIVDKLGWEQTFYTNQFRNEGNAVAAIAPVVETLGRFPKREELRSMGLGSLVYAISTWHGGLEAFKKKAGFPSKKMKRRSSYADPQNLVTELQKIFGSRDVSTPLLIQLKRFDLLYGIEVNGGLSQVWKGMREMRRYSELKEESPTYIAVAEVVAAAKGDTEALDVVLKKMDPLIRRFARKKIVEGYRGM
ncbi:hypothetical protein HY991_04780 [Candidatus Micrarchaeota archaeon]|nr:hypothetical protein [Candidatus Micrarchaeota archaeon]